MIVLSVLLAWSLISVLATLGVGRWLGHSGSVSLLGDEDLRISRS